jgi:hypothetical protein
MPTDPTNQLTIANFAGGIEVELCWDGKSQTRWLMWVAHQGRRTRRRDFATPFLDHGRRTAVAWYGEPIGGWRAAAGLRPGPGSASSGSREEISDEVYSRTS